jgi:hypothetical protein
MCFSHAEQNLLAFFFADAFLCIETAASCGVDRLPAFPTTPRPFRQPRALRVLEFSGEMGGIGRRRLRAARQLCQLRIALGRQQHGPEAIEQHASGCQ